MAEASRAHVLVYLTTSARLQRSKNIFKHTAMWLPDAEQYGRNARYSRHLA